MARTGVAYVAMIAAVISAGALGYAVFWAYQEEAAPVVAAAPPVASAPAPEFPKPVDAVPAVPPSAPATDASPAPPPSRSAAAASLPAATAPALPPTPGVDAPRGGAFTAHARAASGDAAPVRPLTPDDHIAALEPDMVALMPSSAANPGATAAPRDSDHANAASPKAAAPAPQAEAPATSAPTTDPAPITRAAPAQPSTPAVGRAHANMASTPVSAAAVLAPVPAVPPPANDPAPLRSEPVAARAPVEQAGAAARAFGATPRIEAPVAARPMADPAPAMSPSIAAPSGHGHVAEPPRKLRAPPQGSDSQPAPVVPERAERRLAAVPPQVIAARPTATDVPIAVLRGGPRPRHVHSSRWQAPVGASSITVIRGGRAYPTGLGYFVQPGPLILHIR